MKIQVGDYICRRFHSLTSRALDLAADIWRNYQMNINEKLLLSNLNGHNVGTCSFLVRVTDISDT